MALLGLASGPKVASDDQAASPVSPNQALELGAPLEIRDKHVLAEDRLTLPAVSPEPVGRGVTRLRASYLWGNSFSWTQDKRGECGARPDPAFRHSPCCERFQLRGDIGSGGAVRRRLAEHRAYQAI